MDTYISSHYPNLFVRHSDSALGRILCTRAVIEPFTTIFTESPALSGCSLCGEQQECSLCGHCECLCGCPATSKRRQSVSLKATLHLRSILYDLIPSLMENNEGNRDDMVQVQSIKMLIKYVLATCNGVETHLGCVEDLYYDTTQSTDIALKEMSEKMHAELPPQLQQKFPASWIIELASRFKANNFFLDDGNCAVLCPVVSMCNHSCSPNCLINSYNGKLHLRSLSRIEPSQPLTVAYVGAGGVMHIPFFHRQLLMQQRWFFHCCCRRCSLPYDSARVFSCCDCDEGYVFASRDDPCPGNPVEIVEKAVTTPPNSAVPPVTPPESEVSIVPWQCLRCKKTIPENVRHVFLEAERNLWSLLHKNDNQASEGEEPEGMSPLLHTAHYLAVEVLSTQLDYEQSIGNDLTQIQALLEQLLQNEQLLSTHPTLNTISYHKQLAQLYAKQGSTELALQEHEAAYDEICKLKGEDSPDVETVQQFMESFLLTYHPHGESAAQLCGSWANNRKKESMKQSAKQSAKQNTKQTTQNSKRSA